MKKLLLLMIAGFNLQLAVHAQEKWDLKRCVEYAVNNNISVQQNDVQARLSALIYKQNKLYQYPSLSFSGSLSYNGGYTQNPQTFALSTSTLYYNQYGLVSNINIYNFGYLKNTIAASRLSAKAVDATTDKLRNDISLNVANAYLNYLLDKEQLVTAGMQLHYSQANLANTQKLVVAGTLPELNAAELESQVAQDSSAYVTALSNVQIAKLNVEAYMSYDAAAPFELDDPPIDKIPVDSITALQPDDVFAQALLHQPLQKADKLYIEAALKYVTAAKANMLPTISAFGQLGTTYTYQSPVIPGFPNQPYFTQLNTAFRQAIGISLNVPIFNNGTLKIAYQRSQLNLKTYQLQLEGDNLTLKQNIYQAYNLAVAARQKFESNKKALDATGRSYDYAQKRYNVGLLNTIDLLTNQNNYFKAKNDLIYSQYDYIFKMKVLEFYKGLGIKL